MATRGVDEVGRWWSATTSELGGYPAGNDLVSADGVLILQQAGPAQPPKVEPVGVYVNVGTGRW